MPQLDLPEVLADLQAIVSEAGDGYLYTPIDVSCDAYGVTQECTYVAPDGAPSCIVGHVLHRHQLLSIDPAVANQAMSPIVDDHGGGSARSLAIATWLQWFTLPALRALAAAQQAQDNDMTWGEALIAAKEEAARS